MSAAAPRPRNGAARTLVVSDPARSGGIDINEVAHRELRERREVARVISPETEGEEITRRVAWLAVLLALAVIILPGLAWLSTGATQTEQAGATSDPEFDRIAP